MGTCSVCNEDGLTRNCNHCGREVCTTHTLPEKHNCPAVNHYGDDTKHLQSDIDAKLGDDTARSNAGENQTGTKAGSPRQPSDLPPNPNQPSTTSDSKTPSQPSGDSSPDVAPDGSIADSSTASTASPSTQNETGLRDRVQLARLKFEVYWRRAFVAVTSLRVWLVVLVAVASMGQLGLAPVPGMPVTDNPASTAADGAQDLLGNETATGTEREPADSTPTEDDESNDPLNRGELDRGEIETAVHEQINERRADHGESRLNFDSRLQQIARGHSTDMAENEYFSHTAPDGSSFADRYDRAGYDCRVSTTGNRYATGGENIAYTYAYENVEGPNGGTQYYTSEQEIAEGLVNGWMNSTGHRENILRSYWQNEGIGIHITEVDGKTKVYATQNFC